MKITGISRVVHCPDCGAEVDAAYKWTGGPNLKGNDLSFYKGKCSCDATIALIVNAGDEDHREYILSVVDLSITPFADLPPKEGGRTMMHKAHFIGGTITTEELIKRCANPNKLNIVLLALRPGSCLFATRLEYEHYEPDTERNDLFELYDSTFHGLDWSTISIPMSERHYAEKIAHELGLRLADGVPAIITPEGPVFFPVQTPNTYALETDRAATARLQTKEALLREVAQCNAIHEAHRKAWANGEYGKRG